MLTEQDFFDATYAYLTKARVPDVRYAQMAFDLQTHTGYGVAFDMMLRGIRRARQV